MDRLATTIDALNARVGRLASWLLVVMVVLQFAIVLARYIFGAGSVWLQEAVVYMHASLFLLAAACLCLLAGFPVAFTLAGLALVFALVAQLAGASVSLGAIPSRIFGTMTNGVLVAVPLFVFMGVMLERSRVAEALLESGALARFALAALLYAGVAAGLAVSIMRVFRRGILVPVLEGATHITCMVFVILIGATVFSLVFRDLGGEELVRGLLSDLPGGAPGAVLVVMLVIFFLGFFLGFFLDFLEIIFVVVPIVAPILLALEMPDGSPMSPVRLGVMIALSLQTSFLTPPFGFALFYLRGVAPPDVRTLDIYRGIVPFVLIQLAALAALWFLPQAATWLPGQIYGP